MIEIKITGSGTSAEIVGALRQIALDIEANLHITKLENVGECEW